MTDPILERMTKLQEYVQLLEGLRGRDFDDPYMRGALERYFQLASECALDVGEMLIARQGWTRPDTYRGVIAILGERGVLDAKFAEGFEGIAGLRNILVHDYVDVDVGRLEELLDRLDDFHRFASEVASYVDEAKER